MNHVDSLAKELQKGVQWKKSFGQERELTFKYLTPDYHGSAYHSDGQYYTNLSPFTVQQREITQSILDEIADLTGLRFRQVGSDDASNLTFGNYNSTTSTIAGYAFYPNSSESSAIWINTHFLSSFKKIVTHEIGHALGLKHTEDLANPNSVMSYDDNIDELQAADILALRQLYERDSDPIAEERIQRRLQEKEQIRIREQQAQELRQAKEIEQRQKTIERSRQEFMREQQAREQAWRQQQEREVQQIQQIERKQKEELQKREELAQKQEQERIHRRRQEEERIRALDKAREEEDARMERAHHEESVRRQKQQQQIEQEYAEEFARRQKQDEQRRLQEVEQVEKEQLSETGQIQRRNESVLAVKITNDHAFYKLICEKASHYDYSVKQFNLLYFNISEAMIKKPFTIKEIDDFCNENDIPLFSNDELLTLVPKKERPNNEYTANREGAPQHDYLSGSIDINASYIEKNAVPQESQQNYIIDADVFYKFIYKKLCNSEYTYTQYNILYERISEELIHTRLSIDEIMAKYAECGISPPKQEEIEELITKQKQTRSTDNFYENTGLSFQGRIKINMQDKQPALSAEGDGFELNVDLFQARSFEDAQDKNNDGIANNQNILRSLESTLATFNQVFGIKKDNNPLKANGNTASFRLFLFDDVASYQKYLSQSRGKNIPNGGAAENSDNNYISNMYSYYDNTQSDTPSHLNHKSYNYVIRHEFVQALTFYLTSKLDLGKVLMEGLAEYVVHLTEGDSVTDFAKLLGDEYKDYSLEQIIKGKIAPYQTGAAVVAYLEETYPNFMDNLLYAATEDRKTDQGRVYFKQMMEDIYASEANKIQQGDGFSQWVQRNAAEGMPDRLADIHQTPADGGSLINAASAEATESEGASDHAPQRDQSPLSPQAYRSQSGQGVANLIGSMHNFVDNHPQVLSSGSAPSHPALQSDALVPSGFVRHQ